MNIVQTIGDMYTYTTHTVIEDVVNFEEQIVNTNGLSKKYNCFQHNNEDFAWYPINAAGGRNYHQEFSIDNQEILKKHLLQSMEKNNKLVIVEIGVNRNPYTMTSTSVFLDNKRDTDIYIGIDINNKSNLNSLEKNIYTICSPSENIDFIFEQMKQIGINEIDILMIDGLHSINQVYIEWENYTKILASNGMVVMHDTNSHPGPYFLVKSIDTKLYDVYKYLSDVVDWGISVAIKK
jgi:cephalosporin hydroxylase